LKQALIRNTADKFNEKTSEIFKSCGIFAGIVRNYYKVSKRRDGGKKRSKKDKGEEGRVRADLEIRI
jgi:hypothetical protein